MRRIVQVELCNHCNRRCVYCGIPTMKRPKGFITFDTIKRVAEVCKLIGQTEWLGLHHFGESTLHSQLVEFIKYFNDNGISPFLNTNGDLLTDDLIARLATTKLELITISGHIEWEKRLELFRKCTDAGIRSAYQTTMADSLELANLGGQIELNPDSYILSKPVLTDPMTQCGFLRKEMGIVLWNGDITTCCFDYEGHGIYGNIFDDNVVDLVPKPFSICATCPGHPGEP